MSALIRNVILELKRLSNRKYATWILLFFVICIGFVQYEVDKNNEMMHRANKFQEVEKNKIKTYFSYRVYGTYGFRMLFVADLPNIFFNEVSVLPEIHAVVDTTERLKIYNSLKGKNIFSLRKTKIMGYSGIIFFFGTLLAMIYGFEAFFSIGYLKFLSSTTSPRYQFLLHLFTRMIVTLIILILLNGLALLVVSLNGLSVSLQTIYFKFTPICYSLLIFFFALGITLGTLQSKFKGFVAGITLWLILILIIPSIIIFYIDQHSKMLPTLHKHELDKLKIVMGFEKRAIKEMGLFTKNEVVGNRRQQFILSYFKHELEAIHKLEDKMRKQTSNNISFYHTLSMFFPTSHYESVTAELSSRGYLNFLEYYTHIQKKQKEFFKFYMDKVYFTPKPEPGEKAKTPVKVESFIQGEENLYHGVSRLPSTYLWGILLTLFYGTLILLAGYRKFQRSLHTVSLENLEGRIVYATPIDLKPGQLTACKINPSQTSELVFNSLCAPAPHKSPKAGSLELHYQGSEPLEPGYGSLLVLSRHVRIPAQIRVSDYISLLCRLYKKSSSEQRALTFTFIKEKDLKGSVNGLGRLAYRELLSLPLVLGRYHFYLIDDLSGSLPPEFNGYLRKHMNRLAKEGACVLYLTTESITEIEGEPLINEIQNWDEIVARNELIRKARLENGKARIL